MRKQPVNIRPFLYNYLNNHRTYRSLAEFLLDLYCGCARAGGMYRCFSWPEIESLIEDFTDEDLKYFDPILSRLFRDKEVVGLIDIEKLYEFYAVQLLRIDAEMNKGESKRLNML